MGLTVWLLLFLFSLCFTEFPPGCEWDHCSSIPPQSRGTLPPSQFILSPTVPILCNPALADPHVFPHRFFLNFFFSSPAALGLHWDMWASLVAPQGLSWPVACEILVPQPGIKLLSLALEGGFLTTGPPEKSLLCCFLRPWYPEASKPKHLKFLSGQMELWCLWEAEGTKFLRNLEKLGLLVTFR